ncbi:MULTISPECIES: alpha/beta fold hydrolase [unclassified Lentimonas]|uniref:alpha/beta fold hydrolase n=1 Tax=unclassified Lentimonas TaxID=2630993 RepID=UPI0013267FB3|nr:MULTISPECIES: alpha/beta fold hydrolase [unclassified Lentimonas]CAA6692771.1 Choline-sulfatase (EC [Lentimonas sp. CC19]CAA6695064.1 Choline-sulfatase (EC [Lentimonas sp. CC10]CAA7069665.1 Choline-sulfatase (EC [Lentimonas sp. CC11]
MKYFLRLFVCALLSVACLSAAQRPNVLFIAVDDLKPLLSNYGDETVVSPNFERLAEQGMTFLNAHCQQAVCGPSRASVMTGLRPDQTRIWDLKTKIRDENPDVVTIPQHFKRNGYTTAGVGKIYDYRTVEGHDRDDPQSWSGPYDIFDKNPESEYGLVNPEYVAKVRAAREANPELGYWDFLTKVLKGSPPYEGTEDVADEAYDDGQIAKTAVGLIEKLSPQDDPFFIAVGFKKPHLPFIAPKRYWDLYEPDQFKLHPLTARPEGSPDYHFQPGWELRNGSYADVPLLSDPSAIPDHTGRKLIHGYYAAVSYLDAQLGKVLDALDASAEADNTIVVLWGDHGYHLSDHGMWCKHTNYEQSTRVPFMIIDPRDSKLVKGASSESVVELVDIFATLCDLSGLEEPTGIEGTSLKPVLENPKKRVKPFAVSQFPRYRGDEEIMGYAWRDERYRYIEWIDLRFYEGDTAGPVVDIELYDYLKDPEETRNLVNDPQYAEALRNMQRKATVYKRIHGINTDDGAMASWVEVATPSVAVDPTDQMKWREADLVLPYAQRAEGELSLYVFKPEGWSPDNQSAALVAFHGGGWASGDERAFYWQASYLASRGMVVICPNYRIKNTHGTTPLESTYDAMQAMQYVRAHADELGIDPDRIAAAGGSAGGHLAAATATVRGYESKEASLVGVSPRPNALLLFNPVLDTGPLGFGHWYIKPDWMVISPIDQMHGEQPATIIFNGDRDTTTSAERSLAYAEKMHELGNPCEVVLYPDEHHSFFHKGSHTQNFADTLTRATLFLEELGYLDPR